MKILELLLVSFLAASSVLEFQALSHKQGLAVTTTIALGADQNTTADKSPAAPTNHDGYLGLLISQNKIGQVFDGSPAARCGLLTAGDKIMDINDRSTYGCTMQQIADLLTGPVGSSVDIIVEHGDEQRKISLIRAIPVAEEQSALDRR